LIPIHPLFPESNNSAALVCEALKPCADLARQIAKALGEFGVCSFLYGAADKREPQRSLVYRRKKLDWYRNGISLNDENVRRSLIRAEEWFDYPADARIDRTKGMTAVGATPYVINVNVSIDTLDKKIGNEIARIVRESTRGGLKGVESMAFPHAGSIEIACNVRDPDPDSADKLRDKIQLEAARLVSLISLPIPQFCSLYYLESRVLLTLKLDFSMSL